MIGRFLCWAGLHDWRAWYSKGHGYWVWRCGRCQLPWQEKLD